jgi:hypothetical protein
MKQGSTGNGQIGRTHTVHFSPPSVMVREQREADHIQAEIQADPEEALLLYGHMLADIDIIGSELRGLLFAGQDYRSKLRVVRGAAKRMEQRAAKLLGEA